MITFFFSRLLLLVLHKFQCGDWHDRTMANFSCAKHKISKTTREMNLATGYEIQNDAGIQRLLLAGMLVICYCDNCHNAIDRMLVRKLNKSQTWRMMGARLEYVDKMLELCARSFFSLALFFGCTHKPKSPYTMVMQYTNKRALRI